MIWTYALRHLTPTPPPPLPALVWPSQSLLDHEGHHVYPIGPDGGNDPEILPTLDIHEVDPAGGLEQSPNIVPGGLSGPAFRVVFVWPENSPESPLECLKSIPAMDASWPKSPCNTPLTRNGQSPIIGVHSGSGQVKQKRSRSLNLLFRGKSRSAS